MTKPGNVLYLLRSLLKRGPRFLLLYFRESVLFDLLNGTNTHLRVPKPDDGGSTERQDGLLYVASLTNVVRNTLQVARRHLGEAKFNQAQFIDLGCGKGKAVLVYAKEFAPPQGPTALGIEYDRALCTVAWANLERVPAARTRARIHCDSALNLEAYVAGGPLIVYLYNSFQGETLRGVLGLLAKYEHVLIYVDPAERPVLAGYGYTEIAAHEGRYNASTWVVAANPNVTRP
jgi:hypothetical protein